MRLTPQAIWGHQLSNDKLRETVELQTRFTHSNQVAIDSSYLYCFAIKLLIDRRYGDKNIGQFVYDETMKESQRINSSIYNWFKDNEEGYPLPKVNQNIGHLKIAFMWAFKYLKDDTSYEDAIKDILL